MRARLMVFLLLPLLLLTWLRAPAPLADGRQVLRMEDVLRPAQAQGLPDLGPFIISGLWRLSSPNTRFGGFSSLVALGDGRFLAIGDRNGRMRFTPPGSAAPQRIEIGPMLRSLRWDGKYAPQDIEAAASDPVTQALWLALEGEARLVRIDRGGRRWHWVAVPELADWPFNGGAEAMVRLADGRWLILCEDPKDWRQSGLHEGLLFATSPDRSRPQRIMMDLPDDYRPTDAALLPDGRLLVLTRRLVTFPPHFASRIVLADPREYVPGQPWPTHDLAMIDVPELRENYEGMLLRPGSGGKLALWLVSDANNLALQETRLLKLELDPAKLLRTH